MNKLHKIIVVTGPTASGKSDFAVNLALKNNGEIISADSRQIYNGLDIGTGKITKEEMKGVPHYMLSSYELGDDVSVALYKNDASIVLKDILKRGKTPIICGGTGQYIDSLIFDSEIPKVKPNKILRNELEKKTNEELYTEILIKDKDRANKIDKHNRVRLIRALEIINALGKVPKQKTPTLLYPTTIYLMSSKKETLRENIINRLEKRLHIGMIDEVKNIMDKGYISERMKKFGLEYVSIAKYLERKFTLEEMKDEIITKSMQYVKRQMTWNKKYLISYPAITKQIESNNV